VAPVPEKRVTPAAPLGMMSAVAVQVTAHLGESAGQIVREWLTAIGTVLAVFAAVYVGVIRDRLRRPSLTLAFDPETSDRVVVEVGAYGPPDVAYVRLRVLPSAGGLRLKALR